MLRLCSASTLGYVEVSTPLRTGRVFKSSTCAASLSLRSKHAKTKSSCTFSLIMSADGIADKRYFQGLPSPSAAAIVAGMVWSGEEVFELAGKSVEELAFALTVLAGLLMVSNVRYHSFKGINFKEQ